MNANIWQQGGGLALEHSPLTCGFFFIIIIFLNFKPE
jgi:hypothetical protein